MMKRLFWLVVFCVCGFSISAQDQFSKYDDMVGKEVIIYGVHSLSQEYGDFVYEMNEKGKLKKLKIYDLLTRDSFTANKSFHVNEIAVIKKTSYLVCQREGEKYFFIIDKAYPYLKNVRSVSYWTSLLEKYRSEKKYLYTQSSFAVSEKYANQQLLINAYVPVHWKSVQMPAVDPNGAVLLTVTFGEITDNIPVTAVSGLWFLTEDEYQKKKDEHDAFIQEQERQKREQERKDSIRDNSVFTATASRDYIYGGDTILFKKNIVHAYEVDGNIVKGYSFLKDVSVPKQYLNFEDASDYNFLQKRGTRGVESRKERALIADSLYVKNLLRVYDSIIHVIDSAKNVFLSNARNKQLFIYKEHYSYSDYQFGKEFTFFNCFSKTIKYIELTLRPYNTVGDIQRDDIGRDIAKVKGIGPIDPGDYGTYDWDKLFWDDNDIIQHVRVTYVKITFMDGTTKVFPNMNEIDKHRFLDCYSED